MQKKQLNTEAAAVAATSKQKERRIVTWTPEEDDILREQISAHGTENWTLIASKFKDKTTRQCRRRWYTYLNSDFKKGGWSPEEDMLLCEAQKIFGNRWTEIAKVVSGRTDNAVKNRFTTLCKKRAKREALAKENSNAYINRSHKRVIIDNGLHFEARLDVEAPFKKMSGSIVLKDCGAAKQQLRPPFAVLAQNARKVDHLLPELQCTSTEQALIDGNKKIEGTFLKKDDPKIATLMQQAELLSTLAVKVNLENTEQSVENAWKVLQNFLNKNKDGEEVRFEISDLDMELDDLKDLVVDLKSSKLDDQNDLVEDLKSSTQGAQPSQRQPDLHESPSSSEYSTVSTIPSATASGQMELTQSEICTQNKDLEAGLQSIEAEDDGVNMRENKLLPGVTKDHAQIMSSDETEKNSVVVSNSLTTEFCSPLQVTPLFRSLAATIPSPQFSESERHFLMKTLGIESPPLNTTSNSSQPPPCRRALVHSL
ncbi:Transcription factor [Ancistrocladus abbreviatus]